MVHAMMTRRGGRLLCAAICTVSLAVAGCSGGGDGDDDSGTGAAGPLADFFGWDEQARGEDGEFTEEDRQQHYQAQDLIVACMSEAGFEYTPEPFYGDLDQSQQDPNREVWDLQQDDPEAFAREYGYGMTTIDYERVDGAASGQAPNLEYRETLSPAAQEEYDKALWGDWSEYEEAIEAGEEVEPPTASGCSDSAYQEVYDYGGDDGAEEQFDSLHEEWGALEERIENDPRMEAATQEWSGCMADAGYPGLTDRYAGQEEVSQRQGELYGWDDEAAVDSGGGSGGEAAVQPAPTPSFEPVEPDPEDLAELREFELAIATADYTCRQEHDLDGVEQSVRFEHEEQFLESHREELEAYRDYLNEQGSVG
jgi:hypothetical protein